ncbi:MAG: hypothetical protein KAY50_01945 [Chitinophagaceae bacterium]|nr:hypothetical protein [Chitinophagaceae bacterium]
MQQSIRRLVAVATLSLLFFVSQAQPEKQIVKPYKILTSGKQITIKSTKDINHIMLWTTGGYRVVEQKDINKASYTFNIPVNQKTFFLMIGLVGGKIYTERIGLRD